MTEKAIIAMTELQDNINELNQQINAQVNHGEDITTPERKQDFTDFFDPRVQAVQTAYNKLKQLL